MKPGGRLVYATCSLLREENETQIERFLAAPCGFRAAADRPTSGATTIGGEPPAAGDMLRLSPARHGTDGFFVAVLQRKPRAKDEPAPKREAEPEQEAEPEESEPERCLRRAGAVRMMRP